uniref:Ig-like domain-containing protein n=1 Tax=Latimeria chalumnae TaxID=7897 RepID=M3XJK0_LATCH
NHLGESIYACFILSSLFSLYSDTVDVNGDVYANLGEDVLLKCRLETEDQTVQLTWQKQRLPQNENFLTQTPGSPPKYLNDFAKRVKLVGDGNTNGSIIITDVTLFDEDTYICIFTVFPGGPVEKTISLKIRAPPAVSIEPSPDPPEIGSAETLIATCIAAIGRPGAKVIWQTRPFTCSVKESRSTYHNGTETVQSKLLMVPRREIHGQEVNCTVEHPSFMSPAKVPYRISVYCTSAVEIRLHEHVNEWVSPSRLVQWLVHSATTWEMRGSILGVDFPSPGTAGLSCIAEARMSASGREGVWFLP